MNSSVPFVCVTHNWWLCWKKSIWCLEVLGKGTWSIARIQLLSRGLFLNRCARAPFFAAAFSSVPRVTPLSTLLYTSVPLHIIVAVVEAASSSQIAKSVTSAWLLTNASTMAAVILVECGVRGSGIV